MTILDICLTGHDNYSPPPGEHHFKRLMAPRDLRRQLVLQLGLPTRAFNRSVGLFHGKRRTIGFIVRMEDSQQTLVLLRQILNDHPQLQILLHRPGDMHHQRLQP